MKKAKLKFYTHHRSYLRINTRGENFLSVAFKKLVNGFFSMFYFFGILVIKFFRILKNIVLKTCFYAGSLIINPVVASFRAIQRDLTNTKKSFPKRLKLLKTLDFNRSLFLFLLAAGLAYAGLASLRLVAQGLQIKDSVTKTAAIGNAYLSEAKTDLASQDFSQAQNRFTLAYQTFAQGQEEFSQDGQTLNQLLNLLPQKQDANELLGAAGLIAQAGQNLISLEQDVQSLKISGVGITATGQPTAQVFGDIQKQLSEANQYLTEANADVGTVSAGSLPTEDRENFVQLKDQLQNGQLALQNFSQIFSILQNLLLGNKAVLVLFENNNELRATGGFMGTYGNIKLQDGQINKITVSSIYDLDGQLTNIIQPPQPLLNVSDRWYMRDSNWFADFPMSAQTISDFYEKEGGETPDLVIALTPNLIVDWLKITGPITLPKYNLTLTADNFVEQTQVATTLSDNLPTNSPKQILADLVPILLQKISQSGKGELPAIIQSIQDNLNNKQIVIYSRDPQAQSMLEALNWAGNLAQTDRDYLSIVSSNLGGTKTDLSIDQQATLTSTVNPDGSVTDELDITRTNKLPNLDDTNNESYLRVYVPLGSKLISNIGFDYKDLEYPAGENYEINPEVYDWEKNSVTDNLTGTTLGQESGKTFFGNWLNLDGGQTKTVKLVYTLPFKISDIDRYSLLAQKQIGSVDSKLDWTLNFPGYQIAWENFDPDTLNTDNLDSAIIMDKDYFLGTVLQKR